MDESRIVEPSRRFRTYASSLATLWGGSARGPAADEAAFEEYTRGRTAKNVHFTAPLLVLAALLWWPFDFVLFYDTDTQVRLGLWRLAGSAHCLAAFVLFRAVPWARARPLLVYAAVAASGALATGALVSGAGGPDRPFLQGSYLLPWASIVYFGPLRARLLCTALIVSGWLTGTLVFHPETIHLTNFGNAVGFLLVCAVLCVAAGHIIYRLSRQGFLQACALARQTTELAFLNGNLETRVAERTDDLRALAARLTTALEDERGRIAREIHDDLGQAVSAIRSRKGARPRTSRASSTSARARSARTSPRSRNSSARKRSERSCATRHASDSCNANQRLRTCLQRGMVS